MFRSIELPKVPNVIFSQKYYRRYSNNFINTQRYKNNSEKYNNRIKESKFFFGLDGSILSYMKRKGVIDKDDVKEIELRKSGWSEESIADYMKDRPGSTGLFDEEGSIDEEKAGRIKEFLSSTPNIGWSCVMSFLPEYSEEHVNNSYDAQKLLLAMVPEQLKAQGLDPNNFYWFGAYHKNTDHRHIHYVIVPKDATKQVKAFTDKKIVELMPKLVEKRFPLSKNHFPIDRDYFMEEYDESFKKMSPRLTNAMNDILNKKKQYARLNKEERRVVNSVTWNVLNSDKELLKGILSLKRWASEKQDAIIEHKKSVNEKISDDDRNFAKNTYEVFISRVYNRTLKLLHGNQYQNNKISHSSYIAEDKKMIKSRSIERRCHRHHKEKLSSFIKRIITAAANYEINNLNRSIENLWREVNEEEVVN